MTSRTRLNLTRIGACIQTLATILILLQRAFVGAALASVGAAFGWYLFSKEVEKEISGKA